MNTDTTDWIATRAITAIRSGESFPLQVAYDLGGMPFVDPLRRLVQPSDKPRLLRLIRDPQWWHRYLGTNIARPILDSELVEAVRASWKKEQHFHTKLAMIYLLLHYGLAQQEVEEIVEHLEKQQTEFISCIRKFYEGHPKGTCEALRLRLEDPHFKGAIPIYLLSLAILAETSPTAVGRIPALVTELTKSGVPLVRKLANRLIQSSQKTK